jgi:ABC-type transport system substrate-binding protein
MKMSSKAFKYVIQGISLALLIYVVSSSVVPLLFTNAYAQNAPLFSVTIIAPTGGNTVRRQYASIITSNLIALGIDAKLFYVNFDQLVNREFFVNAPAGSSFDQGGYDIGFIGWGQTSPVPDIRSNLDGRPAYLAPDGNNYALYNSPQMNQLFDQLYTSTDPAKQVDLMHQAEALMFHDKPYNYVYEVIDVVPRDQKWTDYGSKDVYSVVTFPDVQHWSGGNSLSFAEAGNVFPGNTLNPAQTTSSNSFYALYIYGAICFAGAGLQEIDSRNLSFYPSMATSITSSPDGLDWTIKIRQGALFQSGVEVTADDFVWSQWAITNPSTASVGLGSNIQYLGNVVDFTFLNGTTATVDNRAKPDETIRKGSWTAVDKYTFKFHLPTVYAFTNQVYAAFSPLPKHILEKFAPSTWDSIPFSTASGPVTYTWDTSKYGGSGSYTAVGPVGAGPYILQSFDFTSNIATLKKFPQYWNASGLQALGQFTVDTYKVAWIGSKDSALAALKNGEVNVLDNNYQLASDKPTLQQMGVNILSAPELGWQEQAFNMMNPIFGTGVDTPLGKSDPSQAAEAARHIRTAISHMIPRDQIVNQLLQGSAYPLASLIGPGWGVWYDPTIKPDTYDIQTAASEMRAAGYNINIAPPPQIALAGTPMFGGSVVITGTSGRVADEMVIIDQSTDGGTTWSPIAAAVTGNDTKYQVSNVPGPSAFGSVMYRANFTGYVLAPENATKPITPDLVNQYISTGQYFGGRPLLPQLVTQPITASSLANDSMIVGAIVIVIIAIVAAFVWRSRKKKPT